MVKTFHIFVLYYILEGGESCQLLTGIFYAFNIHTAVSPSVWSVNAPTAFEV